MSVSGLSYGWRILLNESGLTGRQFPYSLLYDLITTKLFHMKNIIVEGGMKINELLRDKIKDLLMRKRVEVREDPSCPPVVKYYRNHLMHSLNPHRRKSRSNKSGIIRVC